MPLTRTESLVMERWDAGQGLRQIVRETGLTQARVNEIVQIYHCRAETRTHRAQMAHGSALLRTAVLAQFTASQGALS